ncbi:toll/interleukin-1 receptor domain-containing protein [Actinocrispum wychmicini]|uniref:TIR domain-containing protein n=1 Tax=Actinocrispum wychmicini TaxID=1213861 RepID=A0A4V6NNM4_9PSEU|nr:toll/interleukin-1 receptor domain-containing protein [Actinocrispum wychmicini]TCO48920.1 TIR domain-containing protein [Actinocrispum wychmicini]
MTQIFLNYRTEDEKFGVALLDEMLSQRFGTAAVFLAAKSIDLGVPWEQAMFDAVTGSDVLLAIIGRNWLTATNEHGERRLDDPADFVRREIQLALEHGKQVIPVRLDVPRVRAEHLPDDLKALTTLQDIEVRFRNRELDVNRLADKLREQVPGLRPAKQQPTSTFSVNATSVGKVVQAEHIDRVVQADHVDKLWQAEHMTFGDFHA